MSQLEVPVNIEESEINTTFNSFALLIFGTGTSGSPLPGVHASARD
jgi:hypothetical protein